MVEATEVEVKRVPKRYRGHAQVKLTPAEKKARRLAKKANRARIAVMRAQKPAPEPVIERVHEEDGN